MAIGRVLLSVSLLAVLAVPASGGEATSGAAFRIVSFDGRITDAMRAGVEAAGARIIGYEPDDAYIVWADQAQTARLARGPAVVDIRDVGPARKRLGHLPSSGVASVEVGVWVGASRGAVQLLRALGTVAGSRRDIPGGPIVTLTASLPANAIDALARHPAVKFVQPARGRPALLDESSSQIVAGNLNSARTAAVPGYPEWLAQMGLDGTGVRVAVSDTGISQLHPDLADRVAVRYDYTGTHDQARDGVGRDEEGHGTHVAGIVGAVSRTPPGRDLEGFTMGQGVAPGAMLVDQKWSAAFMSSSVEFPSFARFTSDARAAGAGIMNASWTFLGEYRTGYETNAMAVDEVVRDADPDEPGAEAFLWVFAAGNQGAAGPGRPQEAKNIITVGASGSGRTDAIPVLSPPPVGINDLWGSSSRGPTADGRVFPTVVAPGSMVTSTRSPEGYLNCIGPRAENAVMYNACSGTSMAAPHVAGAAALIHQWWKRERGALPSAAMVKALLVNSATDMGARDVPNHAEGWGRVNLGALFSGMPAATLDQERVLSAPGQRAAADVQVPGGEPLRVTLAWTDVPGDPGASKALVNDLDLVVELLDAGGAP
ncbi:MAG: S8 family serine peptidase, partial [Actinomycetota bacterium]|nr:S8 family serine peptidase [Actinomycetota bacterium]